MAAHAKIVVPVREALDPASKEGLAQRLASLMDPVPEAELFARLEGHRQQGPLTNLARNYKGRIATATDRLMNAGYTTAEIKAAIKLVWRPGA